MLCVNISSFIIDDSMVENDEFFNLSLSVVQTSFPAEQLIFFIGTAQIFIVDDDVPGKETLTIIIIMLVIMLVLFIALMCIIQNLVV